MKFLCETRLASIQGDGNAGSSQKGKKGGAQLLRRDGGRGGRGVHALLRAPRPQERGGEGVDSSLPT